MKRFWRGLLLLTVMTAASCMTINIYFPAEKVRGAADQIVDEVWAERAAGSEQGGQAPTPAKPPAKSPPEPGSFFKKLGPRSANAAQDIDVSTPEIRAIRQEMKDRSGDLFPFLDAGNVGLGFNGLLKIRTTEGLGLKPRSEVQRLVESENKDRRRLYKEIAQANGFPDKADEVQAIFADSWRDKASKGWYIEQKEGGWKQK